MSEVRLQRGILGKSRQIGAKACVATRQGETGAVVFGPYERRSEGRYRVEFDLALADTSTVVGDPVAAVIDVRTNGGAHLVAEQWVLRSRLSDGLEAFVLEFELEEGRELEYRVLAQGQTAIVVGESVRVERVGDSRRLAGPLTPAQRAWRNEREFLDGYLRNVSGLIHVGANIGQERRYYWLLGLDVIWVEPIREVYERLVDNIARYPRQRSVYALLSSRTGDKIKLGIANNGGASSSVLALQDHAVIFPGIDYVEQRELTSLTLADMVRNEGISLQQYEALTLDVEGAEQLVLEGARSVLRSFRYVKCEVADFPARTGTPTVADLDAIMTAEGFEELGRRAFTTGPNNIGTYWDVVWKRREPGESLHAPGTPLPLVFDPDEVTAVEKCE